MGGAGSVCVCGGGGCQGAGNYSLDNLPVCIMIFFLNKLFIIHCTISI